MTDGFAYPTAKTLITQPKMADLQPKRNSRHPQASSHRKGREFVVWLDTVTVGSCLWGALTGFCVSGFGGTRRVGRPTETDTGRPYASCSGESAAARA